MHKSLCDGFANMLLDVSRGKEWWRSAQHHKDFLCASTKLHARMLMTSLNHETTMDHIRYTNGMTMIIRDGNARGLMMMARRMPTAVKGVSMSRHSCESTPFCPYHKLNLPTIRGFLEMLAN